MISLISDTPIGSQKRTYHLAWKTGLVGLQDKLKPAHKELLSLLVSQSWSKGHVFSKDEWFAEYLGVTVSTVQRRLLFLEENGFIQRETQSFQLTAEGKGTRKRKIFVAPTVMADAGKDVTKMKGYRFFDLTKVKPKRRPWKLKQLLKNSRKKMRKNLRKSAAYKKQQNLKAKYTKARTCVDLTGVIRRNEQSNTLSSKEVKRPVPGGSFLTTPERDNIFADALSFENTAVELKGPSDLSPTPVKPSCALGPGFGVTCASETVRKELEEMIAQSFNGREVAFTFLHKPGEALKIRQDLADAMDYTLTASSFGEGNDDRISRHSGSRVGDWLDSHPQELEACEEILGEPLVLGKTPKRLLKRLARLSQQGKLGSPGSRKGFEEERQLFKSTDPTYILDRWEKYSTSEASIAAALWFN